MFIACHVTGSCHMVCVLQTSHANQENEERFGHLDRCLNPRRHFWKIAREKATLRQCESAPLIPSCRSDVHWDSRVDCDRSYSSPPVIDGYRWAEPVKKRFGFLSPFAVFFSLCRSLVFSVCLHWFTTAASSSLISRQLQHKHLWSCRNYPAVGVQIVPPVTSLSNVILSPRNRAPICLLSPCPVSSRLGLKAIISLAVSFFFFSFFTSLNYSLVLSRHGRKKTLSKKKKFLPKMKMRAKRGRSKAPNGTEHTNVFIRMWKKKQ